MKNDEMSQLERRGTKLTDTQFNELIQDPANESLLQPLLLRHWGADQDQTYLFVAIGADLTSEDETEREEALWALKALMPELDEILYVRKRTQEDFIDHLRKVLVTERGFSFEKGKDPRPFVRKIAKNWKKDGTRREGRIFSLDKPLVGDNEGTALRSLLPNPTSIEDEILDGLLIDEFLARLDFLTKNEKFVIEAVLAKLPTKAIARELGITEEAVRVLKYRAKQKIKGRKELRNFITRDAHAPWYSVLDPWSQTPLKMSIKDNALSFIRRRSVRIIGLWQFVRRMLARLHTKKRHE